MALSDRPIQGGALIPVVIADAYGGTTPANVTISSPNPVPISENWRAALTIDKAVNDSDKSFTVPADREWQILRVYVKFISDATVGNRQVAISVISAAADVIGRYIASVVQAASLTRYYQFAPGSADLLGFRDTDMLNINMGVGEILDAGQILRVWDNKAIAAATDDMEVYIEYAERTV
jgi:hypothetical protein